MGNAGNEKQADQKKGLEVHEHVFIGGRRHDHIFHSHEDGNVPHSHPDTGPGCYTIDKDEWARKTGLRGGGRKKFTAKPKGEQLPFVRTDPASLTVEVFILDSALHASRVDGNLHSEAECDGLCGEPSFGTAERMGQAFGLPANVHDLRTRKAVSRG